MLQERWENLHGMQLYHREFSLSLTLVPIASKHDATWPNYGHNFQAYEPSLIVPPPPPFSLSRFAKLTWIQLALGEKP